MPKAHLAATCDFEKVSIYAILVQILSPYTKVYSVIYDSGSVPDSSIFSPRESSPVVLNEENCTVNQP